MNSGPVAAALVRESLNRSIRLLFERDFFLLKNDVNERSITHKLAAYLQAEFPNWDVDCEYNRDRHDPKCLELPLRDNIWSDDVHAHTVFPDIIVHHRNTAENLRRLVKSNRRYTRRVSWSSMTNTAQEAYSVREIRNK